MRRVAVTGMGIVSPVGNQVGQVAQALRAGRSGIRAMPAWAEVRGLRSRVAGVVDGIDPLEIPRKQRRTMGRMAVLGSFAALEAVGQAGLDPAALASPRTGLVMGSTTGSAPGLEAFFAAYLENHGLESQEGTTFIKVMGHTVAANVAALLGIRGRLIAPASACACSTQAIGMGYELVRDGIQDIVICGGADDLHPTTVGVFDVVHAASKRYNDAPERTPRPFDRDRDGVVVSEGAAVLVLEDLERARARGAAVFGEVLGYSTGCDAQHMTSPGVDGMLRCMREALEVAGLSPADLDYINAHATGTETGDAAEADALRQLVGDRVPVSATKGYTGHTLAACGAMEAIFCLQMMGDGLVLPTRNLETVSGECGGLWHVLEPLRRPLRRVMSSNFAFGGVNATLVFGVPDGAGVAAGGY